jgi:hypothetical protein
VTAKRIADIRARVEAATPGPWERGIYDGHASVRVKDTYKPVAEHVCCDTYEDVSIDGYRYTAKDCSRGGPMNRQDADFVANARADVPWLLDRLERAEALLRRMQPLLGLDDRDLIEDYAAFHAEVDDNNG